MSRTEFRPLPFFANPDLQTILSLWIKRARLPGPTRHHLIELPDGDQLVLHDNVPTGWRRGQTVAVVLHGLTGSHASAGVVLQSRRLYDFGVRTFRLDLRGVGAGFALARGSYHAGCSSDVRAALERVTALAPDSPIVMAGTSLGGNVALKLAGELEEFPIPSLKRVAALNPPTDLAACTALLSHKRNRLYEWHFVTELVRAALKRAQRFGESVRFPKRLTLRDFDDFYTAPRNGFNGVDDYYQRASSDPVVSKIPIPALILTARDDPFVDVKPMERLKAPANVEVRITDRGGHTAFLGRDGAGGIGWAETAIARWLLSC